jgi:hypothetical protein
VGVCVEDGGLSASTRHRHHTAKVGATSHMRQAPQQSEPDNTSRTSVNLITYESFANRASSVLVSRNTLVKCSITAEHVALSVTSLASRNGKSPQPAACLLLRWSVALTGWRQLAQPEMVHSCKRRARRCRHRLALKHALQRLKVRSARGCTRGVPHLLAKQQRVRDAQAACKRGLGELRQRVPTHIPLNLAVRLTGIWCRRRLPACGVSCSGLQLRSVVCALHASGCAGRCLNGLHDGGPSHDSCIQLQTGRQNHMSRPRVCGRQRHRMKWAAWAAVSRRNCSTSQSRMLS